MWNRITPVVKNLLIINLLFWLADIVFERSFGVQLSGVLGLWNITYGNFHFWQPLTYMFMHGNFAHLFFNMFALFMFGINLEELWGSKRFLLYYLLTGIGAGFFQELVWALCNYGQPAVTIGASGAVFGILLAFGWLFPEIRMFIFPIPIPVRARVFVIIYAVIELFEGIAGSIDGVAHFAHLGGMLFGLILILVWKKKGINNMEAGEFDDTRLRNTWENIKNKTKNFFKSEDKSQDYSKYHYHDPIDNDSTTSRKKEDSKSSDSDKEIARILEKIKQSGYDSLTDEEKQKLFKH